MLQFDVTAETASGPAAIAELGLPEDLLVDLVVKHMYYSVRLTPADLASKLHVPIATATDLLTLVRSEGLAEVIGQANFLHFSYALTERGRRWADEAFERSRYVGAAPVPFEEYERVLEEQSVRGLKIEPDHVRASLAQLVQAREVTEAIGAAVLSTSSVLLYGPSGNGKSTIAAAIRGMLPGSVLVPYAVEVSGRILSVFDGRVHEPLSVDRDDEAADMRFVRCRRPLVTLGSEFALADLEVHAGRQDGVAKAPPQMQANGGVLVVDDLGRQIARAEDLLNRWIGPMSLGVDRLTLPDGYGVDVPFDVVLVFATNLDPTALGDEAFERRIRHKVRIGDPSPDEFVEIARRHAAGLPIPFDEESMRAYIEVQNASGRPLRGAQPGDILRNLIDIATFAGVEPTMNLEQLERAAHAFFVGAGPPAAR